MELGNLQTHRIIIHQIYRRDEEGRKTQPLKSAGFTRFEQTALDAFRKRVVDAVGEGSKAVEMDVVDQRPDRLPALANQMVYEDDAAFVESSYRVAQLLTDAQERRSIPGGIIVVFSGTYGPNDHPLLGVIKAEVHTGYEKQQSPTTEEISLKFVEELLLTPANRLYKTAVYLGNYVEDPHAADLNDRWTVLVSDYQINHVDGKAAARYFYRDFLGCDYPESGARITKRFFDTASDFVRKLDMPEDERAELFNALTTFLRAERTDVVQPLDFAERYLDTDTKDHFKTTIEGAGVPLTGFPRDTTHIANRLKYRTITFSRNIKITAPSEVFGDSVSIEPIEGECDGSGQAEEWTKVIVKDRITDQK